jgi:iron-sulfur cluster repair protein YtfE (RIC family)
MPPFTELIRPHETVREVVQRYPQTLAVFEAAGIRVCCFDCAIRTAALRGGIDLSSLLAELDRAATGGSGGAA